MRLNLVAVGTKMPAWVLEGVDQYSKRLPQDFKLNIIEIPLSQRGKGAALERAVNQEGEAMLRAVGNRDYVVAMDVKGRILTTEAMAKEIASVRDSGRNLTLLVGGPDGLAPACLERADTKWTLSALTFPHPVVRVVIAEQLYRVWSFLNNHPYHRA